MQSLDEQLTEEDKVLRLVGFLAGSTPCEDDLEASRETARAAKLLADEHVETPLPDDAAVSQHAPAVLLAALAMSAVSAMQSEK